MIKEIEYEHELVHETAVGRYVCTANTLVSEEWQQVRAAPTDYCECIGKCHHERWEAELLGRELVDCKVNDVMFNPLLLDGIYSKQYYPVPDEAVAVHLQKVFEEEALQYAEWKSVTPKEREFRDWDFEPND